MKTNNVSRLTFLAIILYLPLSISLIFWLVMVQYIYTDGSWQYDKFYGDGGQIALVWLLIALLPAFFLLIRNSRSYQFYSRVTGVLGFYCLLAGLIIDQNYFVFMGFVFLILSTVLRRCVKK